MTEERVSFLYKVATLVTATENDQVNPLLQSYYLLRCHELTKSYGLPSKQFSPNLRCSHCCQEWKIGNYESKISSLKLSKKQRRRIRLSKANLKNKDDIKKRKDLLQSNQLERICKLCSHTTVIPMIKPEKQINNTSFTPEATTINNSSIQSNKNKMKSQGMTIKQDIKIKKGINVYCHTQDIFSLKNMANNISGTVKEKPKVIKNNKKKKDKFAGLCKEAVMASAKHKGLDNKSKLSLFLKPSVTQ